VLLLEEKMFDYLQNDALEMISLKKSSLYSMSRVDVNPIVSVSIERTITYNMGQTRIIFLSKKN
jgi:hypothetical protein